MDENSNHPFPAGREQYPVDFSEKAGQVNSIRARILWPALGFPAVIAPRDRPSDGAQPSSDATRCICVLLLADTPNLSKADAARHLRYIPWENRGRRFIRMGEPGSFSEEELDWNSVRETALSIPNRADRYVTGFAFGANQDGENGVVVHLANAVRDWYRQQGLAYLYQVRVSEAASARLQDGLYHLFWNNARPEEDAPSDELALLSDCFARPRREALGDLWEQHHEFLMGEYLYEYGRYHPPYSEVQDPNYLRRRNRRPYTEILHPLFVRRDIRASLKIAHITDTHVNVRADVYAENLKHAPNLTARKAKYNNWNTSFQKVYTEAREKADILLITGDLVDYGRGHWGLTAPDRLGEDALYHSDRNWFLFHYLLATRQNYARPVYTILGNHDWRINPYPPFAPGATSPEAFFHDQIRYSEQDARQFLQWAHGPGFERSFSYYGESEAEFAQYLYESGSIFKALFTILGQKKTLNLPHLPSRTEIDSVLWYLMAINPFLDYAFSLPGGHQVLMLDWADEEDLLFPIMVKGKEWPYMPWQAQTAADPGPKARRCLTDAQWRLAQDFIDASGKAKVIGIHAPPIGPYPDWYDAPDLTGERKIYTAGEDERGPVKRFATRSKDSSRIEVWNGHPIFALDPGMGDDFRGMVADYGSFDSKRDEFIRRAAAPGKGVRLVLAGHIHRNGLFAVRVPARSEGEAIAGKMLVHGLLPPGDNFQPLKIQGSFSTFAYPLYLNTTSAGPRGHFRRRRITLLEKSKVDASVDPGYSIIDLSADGHINSVEFCFPPTS